MSDLNAQRKLTGVELQTQQQWLDRDLQRATRRRSGARRPFQNIRCPFAIRPHNNLIRRSGLSADIDPVSTREGEIFNDHNLRLRLGRISLPN